MYVESIDFFYQWPTSLLVEAGAFWLGYGALYSHALAFIGEVFSDKFIVRQERPCHHY